MSRRSGPAAGGPGERGRDALRRRRDAVARQWINADRGWRAVALSYGVVARVAVGVPSPW
jgi:hypothetical protein